MDWLAETLLSSEERPIVETAERVARERIAPRAAETDAKGEFPHADFDDLRQYGLHLMRVPKEYGGLGLSPLAYTLVLAAVAGASASTGLALNMHTGQCFVFDFLATIEQKRRYLPRITAGALLSSAGSDPSSSFTRASVFKIATLAKPVDGGYVISGRKHYVSLADACQYFHTWVVLDDYADYKQAVRIAVVPRDHPRLEIERTWNTLSMRGTASHSLHFDDCFIPAEDLVGGPGEAFLPGGPTSSASWELGYAAVYFGIAEACYEWSRQFARETRYDPDPDPISYDPGVQQHIAHMSIALESARLALYHACAVRAAGLEASRGDMETHVAKYLTTEAAVAVTDHAMRMMGGRGILKRLPLERFFRDARTGVVQPPSSERIVDMVGKLRLGVEARGIVA